MPDAVKEPVSASSDTANVIDPADPLPGFAEAMVGHPMMQGVEPSEPGQSAEAKAVETSETVETPEATTDTPADDKAATPDKAADTPPPAQTVNFDGFSDDHKTTLERLLKAGQVTPAEIEAARKDALRQSYFSRETAALARKAEEFEKSMAERSEDLVLLDKIRGNDRLHAAWLKMSRGEVAEGDPAADDLVDRRTAKQVAAETYDEKANAEKAAAAKSKADYQAKESAVQAMVREQIKMLGVTPAQMKAYLEAEEATLPENVDPILRWTPAELQDRIHNRHEKAELAAKVAALEAQLTKKTSNEARTAKQSLPPARRVVTPTGNSTLDQTEADLELAPDWSNVQGFSGNR